MNIVGGPVFYLPWALTNLTVHFHLFICKITEKDAISRQILVFEQRSSSVSAQGQMQRERKGQTLRTPPGGVLQGAAGSLFLPIQPHKS